MSWVHGYYIWDKRHCWIFKKFFRTKKLRKDYLRRFWKQRKYFVLGECEFYERIS